MSEAEKIALAALPSGAGNLISVPLAELVRSLVPQAPPDLGDNVRSIALQLDKIPPLTQEQAAALADNTQAVQQNTVSRESGGGAVAEAAKSTAKSLLGGVLVSPLISGLVGLFRGGSKPEPPAPVKYAPPESIRFQGGLVGLPSQGIVGVDYGADGMPRATPAPAPSYTMPVTVNVQAIDSRSFLEHRDEIAHAIREALLNGHPLNEVMNEL